MKTFPALLAMLLSFPAVSQTQAEAFPEEITNYHNLFDARETPGVECYRIPALITAPNGDLIAAIDQRVPGCADLRGNRDINIVQRRSKDNGKTWTPIEKVIDFPSGESASDPSMIVDRETGDVFLFYNYMNLNSEKDIYYLHVIKSTDNGQTWGEPVDITRQISPEDWHKDFKFITSGRGIQTNSGRLLHSLVNVGKGVYLFGSDDHGASWFLLQPGVEPADESKVVELQDGTYMINSRVNTGEGYRYVHLSQDKGKTWTTAPEKQLTDPGNNASIIWYPGKHQQKDLLLFSNTKDPQERKNLSIRTSSDQGKTWSKGVVIYPGPAAYSSMTVLENGEIGIFFEKENYKENVFVSFPLDMLLKAENGQ